VQEVEEAFSTAQKEAAPEGTEEDWSAISTRALCESGRMSITYLEAIREAQAKLLRDDKRVFIYGQDVGGTFGGAFKATKRSGQRISRPGVEYADQRGRNGRDSDWAAIEGMRPIVEMQFADFSSIALNQILNNAGTIFWRTGISCPITVRLPSGGTKGSGPFHSQSMEALYSHYPA